MALVGVKGGGYITYKKLEQMGKTPGDVKQMTTDEQAQLLGWKGGGREKIEDVKWAEGVMATRKLGGQVPQAAVNKAEKLLQNAGLLPSERKAPKRFEDIAQFYKAHRPVRGDIWKGKGVTIEVGEIAQTPSGKTGVTVHIRTSKGGRVSTLYVDRR